MCWRRRCSGGPAGSAADQSDTPEGKSHKTGWQHRIPETGQIMSIQFLKPQQVFE